MSRPSRMTEHADPAAAGEDASKLLYVLKFKQTHARPLRCLFKAAGRIQQ